MNKRIDYKFKELVLKMLLMLVVKSDCCKRGPLKGEVQILMDECNAISDGREGL